MAGKCKEMNKIKQALRLHLDGESNRSIGRKLDLYKGTVNKYITLAESCGIPIPAVLAMEEPEIERVLTSGSPAYSDGRFQDLKERLPYIASELVSSHRTRLSLPRLSTSPATDCSASRGQRIRSSLNAPAGRPWNATAATTAS